MEKISAIKKENINKYKHLNQVQSVKSVWAQNIPSQDNLAASIHHSMDVLFHTTNLPALIYDFYPNLAEHWQIHWHHQTSMPVPPCFIIIIIKEKIGENTEKRANNEIKVNKIKLHQFSNSIFQYHVTLPLSQSHLKCPFHYVEIFSFVQLSQ